MPANPGGALARPRRGAPRPLRDDELAPPPHFNAAQRAAWDEAVSTRPGFWCAADKVSLEAWAMAVAFIRAAHANGGVDEPRRYQNALKTMAQMGRILRLSAYDRARETDRVAPPSGLGDEAAAALVRGDASPSATARPWLGEGNA